MRDTLLFQQIRQPPLDQRILGEAERLGEIREARELLIRQGTKRFGEVNASTLVALDMIQDVDRLEGLCDLVIEPDLRCWDDLFRGYRLTPDEPSLSTTCERIIEEG